MRRILVVDDDPHMPVGGRPSPQARRCPGGSERAVGTACRNQGNKPVEGGRLHQLAEGSDFAGVDGGLLTQSKSPCTGMHRSMRTGLEL
jgi:hypothetical protein